MIRAAMLMLLLLVVFPPNVVRKNIDKNSSAVLWKGTKLGGSGSHEGTLRLASGFLLMSGDRITGGKIVVDMRNIRISDIPPDDVVPIRNLTNHLQQELETEKYPTAGFVISRSAFIGKNRLQISGIMRIKNRSAAFAVPADVQRSPDGMIRKLNASFSIDRFAWNIGTNGSWLEKRLVDREIRIDISLVPE